MLLLCSLPIALVVAWYHGDRGHQRVTRMELSILTALFLTGGVLCWRHIGTTDAGPDAATIDVTAEDVLPFENRSALEDDAYFVDAIHDDILTQLSKISALKVISPTDAQLWSESYGRELAATDIFAIQSDVAHAIALRMVYGDMLQQTQLARAEQAVAAARRLAPENSDVLKSAAHLTYSRRPFRRGAGPVPPRDHGGPDATGRLILATLDRAVDEGWRGPLWRYSRDIDLTLDSR